MWGQNTSVRRWEVFSRKRGVSAAGGAMTACAALASLGSGDEASILTLTKASWRRK